MTRPPTHKVCPACLGGRQIYSTAILHDGCFTSTDCPTCKGTGEVPNYLTVSQYTAWMLANGYPDWVMPDDAAVWWKWIHGSDTYSLGVWQDAWKDEDGKPKGQYAVVAIEAMGPPAEDRKPEE